MPGTSLTPGPRRVGHGRWRRGRAPAPSEEQERHTHKPESDGTPPRALWLYSCTLSLSLASGSMPIAKVARLSRYGGCERALTRERLAREVASTLRQFRRPRHSLVAASHHSQLCPKHCAFFRRSSYHRRRAWAAIPGNRHLLERTRRRSDIGCPSSRWSRRIPAISYDSGGNTISPITWV